MGKKKYIEEEEKIVKTALITLKNYQWPSPVLRNRGPLTGLFLDRVEKRPGSTDLLHSRNRR